MARKRLFSNTVILSLLVPILCACGLPLLFRSLFERTNGAQLRALEARLATLEQALPR